MAGLLNQELVAPGKRPQPKAGQVREMNIQVGTHRPGQCPSAARSYQALTFYPTLIYGFDGDRIHSANFRIIGIGNRGLSGIVSRIKVARVRSKQGRHNAWKRGLAK